MNETWIKKVEGGLEELLDVPLWGKAPAFPWEEFSRRISEALEIEELSVSHHKTEWLQGNEILAGMGEDPTQISLELSPLSGTLHWIMPAEDTSRLIAATLSSTQKVKGFTDPELTEGFYRYLAMQAVSAIDELQSFKDLSLNFSPDSPLPEDGALCIDVSVTIKDQSFWGRAVCSNALLNVFKSHFADEKITAIDYALSKKIDISISLEIGSTALSLEEWQKASSGDCILLERCSYDPKTHRGSTTLTLGKEPLFRGRIKENHVKILDYAFYYEEGQMMDNRMGDEEEPLENEEEEEFAEAEAGEEGSLWSAENQTEASVEGMITTHEIPMILTVEVARVRMNLEKLLQLQPGNVIEIHARPELGVSLTMNGKRIAKGELVQMGEAIGVKILQIGE